MSVQFVNPAIRLQQGFVGSVHIPIRGQSKTRYNTFRLEHRTGMIGDDSTEAFEVQFMTDKATRLLLVDDEEELVNYLSKRFKLKGVDVYGVNSGPDALDAARSDTYDVAVVDLKMPEMDGLEVLRGLKELQPHLQVIMLTGHGSIDSAHESGRYDAYKFLSKPYEFEKLIELVTDAHTAKLSSLRQLFQEALEELTMQNLTPRDFMEESRRLRELYEQ